jgi:hypothetical protein
MCTGYNALCSMYDFVASCMFKYDSVNTATTLVVSVENETVNKQVLWSGHLNVLKCIISL